MRRLLGTCLAMSLLLVGLMPHAAVAAVGLTISTPYPSVTVDPGGTAEFELAITTTVAERVDLSVTASPGEGWTTRLRGGGSIISAVFTDTAADGASPLPAPRAIATLEVSVPADAAPGPYAVTLQGRSAAGVTETLTLDLTVEEAGVGDVTLTTQNPVLRARAGTSVTFTVALRNDTNEETTFSLDVQGPVDWDITAQPSGSTTAASFVVAAGASTNITVTADTPDDVDAGQYLLTLAALGGPQAASIELGVEITGSFELTLETQDGRLNARAQVGADSTLNLVVRNTGTSDLAAVTVTSTPPSGWTVTFAPETIDLLPAGQQQSVTATIHASDRAVTGDYSLNFRASTTAQGASASDTIEVRTTVETSPLWGFVGIALIVLVVVGLFFVFRLYGRR